MIPLETIFDMLNRLAGDLRATVITLVSVAVLIFAGMKIFKGGLGVAVCIGAGVAGALVLFVVAGGGMEAISKLFGETLKIR